MEPISLLIAAGAASAASFVVERLRARFGSYEEGAPRRAEDRTERLLEALQESSAVIAEIQAEVETRRRAARELEEEIERGERLLALNREEIEAVAQTVGSQVRAEARRSSRREFMQNVGLNTFFFVLGIVATLLIT